MTMVGASNRLGCTPSAGLESRAIKVQISPENAQVSTDLQGLGFRLDV